MFNFGTDYRNTIRFSPFSRFVVLAGFGNLSGEIDIWDISTHKLIGSAKVNCAKFNIIIGALHGEL
jgi:translation initiation factor 2A